MATVLVYFSNFQNVGGITSHQWIFRYGSDVSISEETRKSVQHDRNHLVVVVFHCTEIEKTLNYQIFNTITAHYCIITKIFRLDIVDQSKLHFVILLREMMKSHALYFFVILLEELLIFFGNLILLLKI